MMSPPIDPVENGMSSSKSGAVAVPGLPVMGVTFPPPAAATFWGLRRLLRESGIGRAGAIVVIGAIIVGGAIVTNQVIQPNIPGVGGGPPGLP